MLKRLFSMCAEEVGTPVMVVKTWLAQVVGGAIVADRLLHHSEMPYIEKLIREIQNEPEVLLLIREIMKDKEPPPVEPMRLSAKLADQVLKCVLDICACDCELAPGEIRYVNEVGMALNMDTLRVHKLINFTVRRVKVEFFNLLLQDLHEEERYWLAVMVLKSIYADGRINKNEIAYFNDIYELLEGDQALIEKAKRDSKNLELADLPKVHFIPELSHRILRYLLEITMNDEDIDDRELKLVREIAQALAYEEEELERLMDGVEAVKFFMHASAELVNR